MATRSS